VRAERQRLSLKATKTHLQFREEKPISEVQ
jgi:hypothetical protein